MTRLFNLDFQLLHDTILMAISVFVLFTVMSYNLFEPVRKMLKGRQEKIKTELESAVDKEAEVILSEARTKALRNENRIIGEAKEEAARIIRRANEEAELEKKRVMDEMKQEMIEIASMMAGKVVAASIDTTIQDALVEETLKEMGDTTWQN